MALAAVAGGQAATITVTNLPGGLPVPLIDLEGEALSGGSVRIGRLRVDEGFFENADPRVLLEYFEPFAAPISASYAGFDGLFLNSLSSTVGGTSFAAENVYVLALDGSEIADSSGFLLYGADSYFVNEPGATADVIVELDGNVLGTRMSRKVRIRAIVDLGRLSKRSG